MKSEKKKFPSLFSSPSKTDNKSSTFAKSSDFAKSDQYPRVGSKTKPKKSEEDN